MSKKIVVVCTSHSELGDSGEKTGAWAEEIAAAYLYFSSHDCTVTIASIKGGEIPMDEVSLNPPFVTKDVETMLLEDAAMAQLTKSTPITDIKAADFDAIYLVGGHGVCWDFESPVLGELLTTMAASGKVVSAVCHGVIGLVTAKAADGKPLIAGKKVTGFSNTEEHAVAKEKLVPYLTEDKMKELGGIYSSGPDWGAHVERDGLLITGQNPGSSRRVAEVVIEALST